MLSWLYPGRLLLRSEILTSDHNKSIDVFHFMLQETSVCWPCCRASKACCVQLIRVLVFPPLLLQVMALTHNSVAVWATPGKWKSRRFYRYFSSPLTANSHLNTMQGNAQIMSCLHLWHGRIVVVVVFKGEKSTFRFSGFCKNLSI